MATTGIPAPIKARGFVNLATAKAKVSFLHIGCTYCSTVLGQTYPLDEDYLLGYAQCPEMDRQTDRQTRPDQTTPDQTRPDQTRQTDTQTHRDTQRHTQTDRQRERERMREREKEKNREREKEKGRGGRRRERERENKKRVKFEGELSQTKVVKQNCSSPSENSPSEIGLKYLFLSSK